MKSIEQKLKALWDEDGMLSDYKVRRLLREAVRRGHDSGYSRSARLCGGEDNVETKKRAIDKIMGKGQ